MSTPVPLFAMWTGDTATDYSTHYWSVEALLSFNVLFFKCKYISHRVLWKYKNQRSETVLFLMHWKGGCWYLLTDARRVNYGHVAVTVEFSREEVHQPPGAKQYWKLSDLKFNSDLMYRWFIPCQVDQWSPLDHLRFCWKFIRMYMYVWNEVL